MQKPDQNQSRIKIRDMFVNKFNYTWKIVQDPSKRVGELIVSSKDPIWISSAFLDRLLLSYIIKNRITKDYFDERHLYYAINVIGIPPDKTSSERSNLLKAIKHGNISPAKFSQFFNVLGLEPKEVAISFESKEDGSSVEIKIDNKSMNVEGDKHVG